MLSPLLYLRRNPGKTLPMAGVILLAVTMVASVVTIVRSIDLTIYTLYGYNRYLTGLTPRNALQIVPTEVEKVRRLPELGFLYPVHSYNVMVKTIFGKMAFPIFGLEPEGRKMLLARCGVSLAAGRMPEDGAAEAVISDDIARNLGVKVGDILLKPEAEDAFAPVPVRLVGLLRGRVWLGVTSKSFVDAQSPFTWVGYLAFAPTTDLEQQRQLDRAILRVINKGKARAWYFGGLVRETRSALTNLYLILNLVIGIIVLVIAFVCGLLSNIYFSQRLPEIATLAAIGYTRASLLRRAVGETALFCLVGWLLGSLLTIAFLLTLQRFVLTPKGLLLNPFDLHAYLFTLPLPITITLFAFVTVGMRLSSLDPVTIIERRG